MQANSTLRGSVFVGVVSLLLVLCLDWTLVHVAYRGNWTALFCSGGQFTRPPELSGVREFVFAGAGYDGQFYRVIAHDPLFRRDYDRYIDAPRLRYRRILIPGLAWLLAAGKPEFVDWTYMAVCWCLIALGATWLAGLAMASGRSSFWGLLFLITPATLSTLERMTVDVGIAALALGCLLAALHERWRWLWLALAAASLCKETGILIVVAVAGWLVLRKRFGLAAVLASSVLPALGWYAYVHLDTRGDFTTSDFHLLTAFFVSLGQTLKPGVIPLGLRVADGASVLAFLWIALRCLYLAIQERFERLDGVVCAMLAMLLLLFQNSSIWEEPNGFTRVYSPLLACHIAATFTGGFRQTLATFAVASLPLWLQFGVHLMGPAVRELLP